MSSDRNLKAKRILPFLLFLFTIICASIFIRQYRYFELLTCGQDQGVHLSETWKIYTTKKITLLGVASDLKVYGREFYSGPVIHYLALPFLIIFGWEQRSVSYLMMILGLSSSLLVFWVLNSKYGRKQIAYIFLILYSLSPVTVHTDRLFWAPSFMFSTSTYLIALLLLLANVRKYQNVILFTIGFFMGFGLQIHYPFIFAIMATLIWLKAINKINIINLLVIIAGFALGFLPIIVFELRHQFYNTLTVLQMVFNNSDLVTFSLTRNFYYFSLIPFIYLFIAYMLTRIRYKSSYLIVPIVTFATVIWYFHTLPENDTGITMPIGFNSAAYSKMRDIIINEHKDQFNILDQLTGESRALYLRAILTVSGNSPMQITDYPSAKFLYVFTKNPANDVLKSDQWEIQVLKPARLLKEWHIQNEINLYLLEKINL